MPTTTVDLGILEGFTLDDPVAGVLDNTEYLLGDVTFVDVTDRVRSVEINRGRSSDLDVFDAGQATIQLNNFDRAFDPKFSGSPFDGFIKPRQPVRVFTNGELQFTGSVDDWSLSYPSPVESYASITASDGFAKLARQVVGFGTAVQEFSGVRIEAVLDYPSVAWPETARDIDTGKSLLAGEVFDGENALQYLQSVAQSEQGALFISKSGRLVFKDRGTSITSDGALVFSDAGNGVPYINLEVSYSSDKLFNAAIVSSPNAGTATSSNLASQLEYGVFEYKRDTLLDNSAQLQEVADFIVGRYGVPEYRFEQLTVQLDGLSTNYLNDVLNLDLADIVQVEFTPNNVGSPVNVTAQIIRLNHLIDAGSHSVTIGIASLPFAFFVLDDAVYGVLDNDDGRLGF